MKRSPMPLRRKSAEELNALELARTIAANPYLAATDVELCLALALTAPSREAEMRAALKEIKAQAENATFAREALTMVAHLAGTALSSPGSSREDGWRDEQPLGCTLQARAREGVGRRRVGSKDGERSR